MQFIKGDQSNFMVILEAGDEVLTSLRKFAQEVQLKGGFFSGIGALTQVELGFYNRQKRKYFTNKYGDECFELISLTGNLSYLNNEYLPHIHVLLGRDDYSTIGGHLVQARVDITLELAVTQLGITPSRKFDDRLDLPLITNKDF